MTLNGVGLFFQRDQTWWKPAKAWMDYTQRCQALLQQGVPVTDVAVFTGEENPRRAFTPDRLVPALPGIFGEERVDGLQQPSLPAGHCLRHARLQPQLAHAAVGHPRFSKRLRFLCFRPQCDQEVLSTQKLNPGSVRDCAQYLQWRSISVRCLQKPCTMV